MQGVLTLLLGAGLGISEASASSQPEAAPESKAGVQLAALGQALRGLIEDSRVTGLAQVEYQHRQISLDELAADTRRPLNENQFWVPRARLRLAGAARYLTYAMEGEFFGQEGRFRPVNLELGVRLPGAAPERPLLELRAGLIAIPFGFENGDETDRQRFFAERSLFVRALFPGRFDLGVALGGHLGLLDWQVALQNGEPIGAAPFSFRDPNNAKDLAGRVRVHFARPEVWAASLGVSGLYGKGFSAGTPATKDTFEWQDLNEDGRILVSELIAIPGSAGRASENFRRWGLGLDLQLRASLPKVGELFVYTEAAIVSNLDRALAVADPVLFGRDQRGFAVNAAVTQELGPWLMVGLRFESYRPRLDELELFAGHSKVTRPRFDMIYAGVAARLAAVTRLRVRLLAEYEHQVNRLGRDANGRPAQLDNDSFRLRLEAQF